MVQTVSLDTSTLQSNTVRYMWSGVLLQMCYPEINSDGTVRNVFLPIQKNGLRLNDQFDIDRTKTPVVYFTCHNTQRLHVFNPDIDLIQCEILLPSSFYNFITTGAGDISIEYTKLNVGRTTQTYSNPSDTTIRLSGEPDIRGMIVRGNVTKMSNWTNDWMGGVPGFYPISDTLAWLALGNGNTMTQLNLSSVPKLQILELYMESLQTLDISNNPLLNILSLYQCNKLSTIYTKANNNAVATEIAAHISRVIFAGIVYCNPNDTYYSVIATAAQNAGWTIRPLV